MHGASGGPAGDPADGHHQSGRSMVAGIGGLCATAVRLTGADGAAVAVLSSSTRARELVYATDATARQIDELQFVVGEGPCIDAYVKGRQQMCPDLAEESAGMRWPGFTAEVVALGVSAAFAFPVPGTWRPVGVLELYRRTAGDLTEGEQRSAGACALATGTALHHYWSTRMLAAGGVENTAGSDEFDQAIDDMADEFSRSEVYVASGMVAVQLAVSTAEALDRLRAYCYAHARSITDVAAEILAHRLSLRDQRDNPGSSDS
ncbi:GAF and ANTAR domain-containing protein [Nocardia brasiliensis]|uniref:GAF and ANTAR domain-containing protein n=1 Tax=Nocardia brasiliensis TaxID=37326 RepID=UPI003673602C